MLKRVAVLLLALNLIVPMALTAAARPSNAVTENMPVVVEDSHDRSQECGENLTWTLDDGVLTISGTGRCTIMSSRI